MPDPGDGDPAVGLVEVDDVVLVLGAGPEAAVHTHDTLRSKQGNKSRPVCRFWLSTSFFIKIDLKCLDGLDLIFSYFEPRSENLKLSRSARAENSERIDEGWDRKRIGSG